MKPVNYTKISSYKRKEIREAYIQEQDGKCYYCNNPLKGLPSNKVLNTKINLELFPTGFMTRPIHLHHNHQTGMTIGAVHCRCNAVLWQYHHE